MSNTQPTYEPHLAGLSLSHYLALLHKQSMYAHTLACYICTIPELQHKLATETIPARLSIVQDIASIRIPKPQPAWRVYTVAHSLVGSPHT